MSEEYQEQLEIKKEPKERKPRGYRFVGRNRFLNGMPARDIPIQEWRELPENMRELALSIRLYEVIK